MGKSDKIRHTKNNLINALEKSMGVVTTACKKVGIHRSTFYEYYNNDEEFRQSVDDIGNVALDFTESKMFEQIQEGNTQLIKFYLSTRGKKRGYVERQEITGADGMPTNFQIEIIDNIKDTDE
jgi:predicted DNA-binding transcriptional regulator AlpA|tara:strand:+ start:489 stop:857 length:369 start_codon:yes stop_codon:yes gene_type:complete